MFNKRVKYVEFLSPTEVLSTKFCLGDFKIFLKAIKYSLSIFHVPFIPIFFKLLFIHFMPLELRW